MANLKERDFYWGAVLSVLINNGVSPALIAKGTDRQVYSFAADKGEHILFLKYRAEPDGNTAADYQRWQFAFSDDEAGDLRRCIETEKQFSVGLVCGRDGVKRGEYAVLSKEDVKWMLDENRTAFTISRKDGENGFYRVSPKGGRDNAMKIPANRLY